MSDYPDFTISALLKGLYAGNPKALAVDQVGNMIAMLKGKYLGSPIDLETDINGNLNISLEAQALSEIINRFKYGTPSFDGFIDTIPASGSDKVFTLRGKGQIYSAFVNITGTASLGALILDPQLDSYTMEMVSLADMYDSQIVVGTGQPVVLAKYDDVNFEYAVIIEPGYTFETLCELFIFNHGGVDAEVDGKFYYSLI